ncbi:Glucoamylase (glucan-1,4-alpha-glucosidase), GH15 family [Streptomyces zhaozhouensis]|uniref:Glucoamylase (Glucan-1,4-alpha-glucosidase), GH15 family n=1 Tax=Streptomyces zhaozhouensis TaxID=1300267 RepID=A0A286E473_9ACTN|nr:glycoside hydrolase family 15 protein [Streptomyces zhaozhouensis]SOD65710.1 Glucoamylase (glucan-1,4-alpha-glucosidase), GH15 family [Streptomyces zhaozhouensis]
MNRLDPPYLPIAEHGLIGDLRTAALVGTDGRIDWFCAPRFDSPSVFGALLDPERGGHWLVRPGCEVASRQQFYFPDTNILITRMLTEDGMVEVQDFMPVLREHDPDHRQRLVRRVVNVRGSTRMRVEVAPRFDYGRGTHRAERRADGVLFTGEGLTLSLLADVPLTVDGGDAVAAFPLAEGESALFVLDTAGGGEPAGVDTEEAERLFTATVAFWRRWIGQSVYSGRWRETVNRSALTLKLLTHEPSGALIAAPTLGLPERIGGERNWDYRHVWIRDAAFSLYALLRLGFTNEAEAFINWLTGNLRASAEAPDGVGPLRVMYSIDGDPSLPEEELSHLAGYCGTRPVRTGNGASHQLQLDIYGELVDSVYLFNKYGTGISHDSWTGLRDKLEWLLENWDRPDEGIWETRAGRQDHTYSRLMCWVAVERMIRMARQRGLPGDLTRWMAERDRIYTQIMDRGWDPAAGAFTQRLRAEDAGGAPRHSGGDGRGGDGSAGPGGERPVLDASLLLMPMVKLISPTDPRFLSTLDAVTEHLVADTLVFRYDPSLTPDGLGGTEGTFSLCSFWWVEALTRAGRIEQARLGLEKMFTYANHVGQYAEQISLTGEHLGNFPQAFTHLALISAAVNLDRAMG